MRTLAKYNAGEFFKLSEISNSSLARSKDVTVLTSGSKCFIVQAYLRHDSYQC